MKLLQSKKPAFAIPLAILAVIILSVIGVGLLSLGMHGRLFSVRNTSEVAARCTADAALTKALFEMNEKLKVTPWDGSILPQAVDETLPNSDAIFSYTVTGDIVNGFTVECTGKSGRVERKINATLKLQGPFEPTILTRQNIILKGGTLVEGYNSLDPWDTDTQVLIGTNSILANSIILNSGVIVDGDIFVGIGGDIETAIKDLGANINSKYALSEEIEFLDVTPPLLPDMDTDISIHGTTLTIGPADNGEYEEIQIKRAANPGIMQIDGGDVVLYVTEDIGLGQECEIIIKEGASLTLYLDGDLNAGNNAGINNESLPASLKLFGTSTEEQQFTLKAKSESLGAVYAPNAVIILSADGDVRGSIVSKSFEMKSGGNFYYDEALRNVDSDDDAVRFVVQQWREE
ncbi:MAG: DUF7305 domain-containing protein [Planctomycetota bacterium]|jgi:hypothetical protein